MESGTVEPTAESPSTNAMAPQAVQSSPEPVTQSPSTPEPSSSPELTQQPSPQVSSDVPSTTSSESKPVETRIVPIELHNINLLVELRVPVAAAQSFAETQSLIQRLREKFGQDALIEELSQVLNGTIEKVSISRPSPEAQAVAISQPQQAQPQQPVQVQIPQSLPDYGAYVVQSTSTPWHGNALKNLDPSSIYKVLYSPEGAALRPLLTAQDVTMMDCYYRAWHDAQVKKN